MTGPEADHERAGTACPSSGGKPPAGGPVVIGGIPAPNAFLLHDRTKKSCPAPCQGDRQELSPAEIDVNKPFKNKEKGVRLGL